MALSTTATATHVLLKYSKSNPSTAGGAEEWQHYVNPILTLILDVKKSFAGELESVRLRIVWTMNSGNESAATQVVFEDLDLLSFSSIQPLHAYPPQGLPLKAVYKDSVVGIRYLHPLVVKPGNIPTYRRFQVIFSSSTAVTQFIDCIRVVCPCKPNVPAPARAMTWMPPTSSQMPSAEASQQPGAVNNMETAHSQVAGPSPAAPASTAPMSAPILLSGATTSTVLMTAPPFHTATATSRPAHPTVSPAFEPNVPITEPITFPSPSSSTLALPLASSQPSALALDNTSRPQTSHSSVRPHNPDSNSQVTSAQCGTPISRSDESPDFATRPQAAQSGPKDRSSTQSTTSVGGSNSITPPAGARDTLLNSLREDPKLIDALSREELEHVVATVIRQPGFVKLLESLDSLWTVKGYLAR